MDLWTKSDSQYMPKQDFTAHQIPNILYVGYHLSETNTNNLKINQHEENCPCLDNSHHQDLEDYIQL